VLFQKITIPPGRVIGHSKCRRVSKEPNLEFPGGWGVSNQKPSVGEKWTFSGTTHCNHNVE